MLPGLIFVFLKLAGRNEFKIPVYYENGVDSLTSNCTGNYTKPYHLSDSVWTLSDNERHAASLMIFADESFDMNRFSTAIREEFDPGQVWIGEAVQLMDDSSLEVWRNCLFFIKAPYQVVLYDADGRIRGYYKPDLREDMDRLRVELKILLEKY